MANVDKEFWVKAPIKTVFGYIHEPSNWPEFWPSFVEIKDIQSLPNGGHRALGTYKMLGMRLEGTGECTQIVPNRFLVIETTGGISSTIAWTFRSWENKTRVTLTVEYKVPIPLLGRLAEAIIVKMNEHEADLIIANLQTIFEANRPRRSRILPILKPH